MPVNIGIIGNHGALANLLIQSIKLLPKKFNLRALDPVDLANPENLHSYILGCDVLLLPDLFFLALNTDESFGDGKKQIQILIQALEVIAHKPHLFCIESANAGESILASHKGALELYKTSSYISQTGFKKIVLPETFGPLSDIIIPGSVNELCYLVSREKETPVESDKSVELIYAGDAVSQILNHITDIAENGGNDSAREPTNTMEVNISETIEILTRFYNQYSIQGIIPAIENSFEKYLFLTLFHYAEHDTIFPKKLIPHADSRGVYAEVVKANGGGQVSFSTTLSGITRGNHFHTRKLERFAVLKGTAKIDLRRVDSDEILSFELNGELPSFVDMPIWFTHSITNTGTTELVVLFWINEIYNPNDPDTFPSVVEEYQTSQFNNI